MLSFLNDSQITPVFGLTYWITHLSESLRFSFEFKPGVSEVDELGSFAESFAHSLVFFQSAVEEVFAIVGSLNIVAVALLCYYIWQKIKFDICHQISDVG